MVLILHWNTKYSTFVKILPKLTADVKMQMEQQIKAQSFFFFSRPLPGLEYQMSFLTENILQLFP